MPGRSVPLCLRGLAVIACKGVLFVNEFIAIIADWLSSVMRGLRRRCDGGSGHSL